MTTLKQDVDEIRSQAFARQAADENRGTSEDAILDTVCKARGAASGFDYTMLEIASGVGLGDTAYPAQNVKKVLNKATEKFIRHYCWMIISDAMIKLGSDEEEACQFAFDSFNLSIECGETPAEILRGWLDA